MKQILFIIMLFSSSCIRDNVDIQREAITPQFKTRAITEIDTLQMLSRFQSDADVIDRSNDIILKKSPLFNKLLQIDPA